LASQGLDSSRLSAIEEWVGEDGGGLFLPLVLPSLALLASLGDLASLEGPVGLVGLASLGGLAGLAELASHEGLVSLERLGRLALELGVLVVGDGGSRSKLIDLGWAI
jgi:hypothetical protein